MESTCATETGHPGQLTSTTLSSIPTASSNGRALTVSMSADVITGGKRKACAATTPAAATESWENRMFV